MNNNASDSQSMREFHDVLDRALSQLKSIRESRTEPIAVIGAGCRFPGASSPEAFWELLDQGRSAIAETPADRWNGKQFLAESPKEKGRITCNRGGFISDVDLFDAAFFNISGREASLLDPQQRLLLEVAWETLENAGINPQSTKGGSTGVYIGICSNDYLQLLTSQPLTEIDAWISTGNAHGSAAGRLSYFFDWRGPCLAVDTACSSSLVALHLAVQALRNDECQTAFVAGVNLMLSPELSISLSQAGMLSPDGKCKTFSDAADGFVRGEGCGAILLKRLSRAMADGDQVLCLIRGSASNQDGRSIGLTAPNGLAQQAVIRSALANATLGSEQISYIEAHGTGTSLGDPVEMSALESVFAPNRPANEPLIVGSVKTNLGHLEGGAGIAGVIKTALALSNKTIPPHLHCEVPSTKIHWDWPVQLATDHVDWPSGNGNPRAAGVSSFGFGGTNAHVILEESSIQDPLSTEGDQQGGILKISAKTPLALEELANLYAARLNDDDLERICRTSCVGRADFPHRIALPATNANSLRKLIHNWREGKNHSATLYSGHCGEELLIGWIFPSRLTLSEGYGKPLYEANPFYRAEWEKINEELQHFGTRNLSDMLWRKSNRAQIENAISLVAVQYLYGQLLLHWGLEPSRILGHGLGELAAGCLAGHFKIRDALRLVMDSNHADQIDIFNGTYSYHSSRTLANSSLSPRSPHYWREVNLHDTGNPAPAMEKFLPHGMFPLIFGNRDSQGTLQINAAEDSPCVFVMNSQNGSEWNELMHTVCRLYVAGAAIRWNSVFPAPFKRISLPTYPFQRKRYWISTNKSSELSPATNHPFLQYQTVETAQTSQFELDLNSIGYLRHHQVRDTCLCPLTFFLEMASVGAKHVARGKERSVRVSDLVIQRPLLWKSGTACEVRATFTRTPSGVECQFEFQSENRWLPCSRCEIVHDDAPPSPVPVLPLDGIAQNVKDHYERFSARGLNYTHEFRCVHSLMIPPQPDPHCLAWGNVVLPDSVDCTSYQFHPALLDGCLQVTMTALQGRNDKGWMPIGVKDFRFHQSPPSPLVDSIVRRIREDENGNLLVDISILDDSGSLVAEVRGLTLKQSSSDFVGLLGNRSRQRNPLVQAVLESSPDDLSGHMASYVRSRLAGILDCSAEELDLRQPLMDMGMDSLMAIELSNAIQADFQIAFSMEELLDILTPYDLMTRLIQYLELRQTEDRYPDSTTEWVEGAI